MNYYNQSDHITLSEKIKKIRNASWVVSYDNVSQIKQLYTGYPSLEFELNHSAHTSKLGQEIMFFSKNITCSLAKHWS